MGSRVRQLPHVAPPLRRLRLYHGTNFIYIIGDTDGTKYKVLRIDRTAGDKLALRQEAKVYSHHEVEVLIEKINRIETPEVVAKVYAIVGFLKILDSYYVWVVTKGHKVGVLHSHYVYQVEKTQMFRVCNKSRVSTEEAKHQKILMTHFDLSKQFYFSYTYDLTNTFEGNCTALSEATPGQDSIQVSDMFVWNAYLLWPFLKWSSSSTHDAPPAASSSEQLKQDWVVPLIHGFFRQRSIQLKGQQTLRLTLIARRSRHHAGTRFLKRGLNQLGYVANEVESEQILSLDPDPHTGIGAACSFVQVRGSIPLFWSHTNIMAPKPDIFVTEPDPSYAATRAHFERLFARYGDHVTILNLVRQIEKKPRESYLSSHFAEAVGLLNEQFMKERQGKKGSHSRHQSILGEVSQLSGGGMESVYSGNGGAGGDGAEEGFPPLEYISYDFLTNMKRSQDSKSKQVFEALMQIGDAVIPQVGLFTDLGPRASANTDYERSRPTSPILSPSGDAAATGDDESYYPSYGNPRFLTRQTGIIRTNCIDCLDRTNVAQFCIGRVALDRQLEMLGLKIPSPQMGEVAKVFMELFADHGDCISQQYGGSGAMHKVDEAGDEEEGQRELILTGGAKNAMIAVQRYYSNNVTDYERQAAMDLFLGVLIPQKGDKPGAWEKLFRSSGEGEGDPTTLEQVIKEVEHDELQATKACGELALYRNIVGGRSSLFFFDGFDPVKLTAFSKILEYDFEVPVLKAVPCDYLGPPPSHTAQLRRRLVPAAATVGEEATIDAAARTDGGREQGVEEEAAQSYTPWKKKRRGAQEEMYSKYVKLEVLLKNPLVPVKSNLVAYLPYQLGAEGMYDEYLAATDLSEEATQRVLRNQVFPPHRQRQRIFRARHSFDDFLSLQRRLVRDCALGEEEGQLTSFDALVVGHPSGDPAYEGGQEGGEKGAASKGALDASQQATATSSAGGGGGVMPGGGEGSDSRGAEGGMGSKLTKFFKKWGPGTSSSNPPSSSTTSGTKAVANNPLPPPLTTPSLSQQPPPTPTLPSPAQSSTPSLINKPGALSGGNPAKGEAAGPSYRPDGGSNINNNNLAGGVGREEVSALLEQVVGEVVEQTRRERQQDLEPLKVALERIRQQQQILQRILEEAINAR